MKRQEARRLNRETEKITGILAATKVGYISNKEKRELRNKARKARIMVSSNYEEGNVMK